jgi:hypothetical protein
VGLGVSPALTPPNSLRTYGHGGFHEVTRAGAVFGGVVNRRDRGAEVSHATQLMATRSGPCLRRDPLPIHSTTSFGAAVPIPLRKAHKNRIFIYLHLPMPYKLESPSACLGTCIERQIPAGHDDRYYGTDLDTNFPSCRRLSATGELYSYLADSGQLRTPPGEYIASFPLCLTGASLVNSFLLRAFAESQWPFDKSIAH